MQTRREAVILMTAIPLLSTDAVAQDASPSQTGSTLFSITRLRTFRFHRASASVMQS